jgi:hypothetical protein
MYACSFLNNNQLSVSIPSSIGNLAQVNFLYESKRESESDSELCEGRLCVPTCVATVVVCSLLNNNELVGTIPDSVAHLTNVVSLYVLALPCSTLAVISANSRAWLVLCKLVEQQPIDRYDSIRDRQLYRPHRFVRYHRYHRACTTVQHQPTCVDTRVHVLFAMIQGPIQQQVHRYDSTIDRQPEKPQAVCTTARVLHCCLSLLTDVECASMLDTGWTCSATNSAATCRPFPSSNICQSTKATSWPTTNSRVHYRCGRHLPRHAINHTHALLAR